MHIYVRNDVFTRDCECARGCDVIACAAGNKRIGSESARSETEHRPIGASLVFRLVGYSENHHEACFLEPACTHNMLPHLPHKILLNAFQW